MLSIFGVARNQVWYKQLFFYTIHILNFIVFFNIFFTTSYFGKYFIIHFTIHIRKLYLGPIHLVDPGSTQSSQIHLGMLLIYLWVPQLASGLL